MMLVRTFPFYDRSAVIADLGDRMVDIFGMVGHDKQSLLLVAFIQNVKDLGRGKLENNGVEGFVPAE